MQRTVRLRRRTFLVAIRSTHNATTCSMVGTTNASTSHFPTLTSKAFNQGRTRLHRQSLFSSPFLLFFTKTYLTYLTFPVFTLLYVKFHCLNLPFLTFPILFHTLSQHKLHFLKLSYLTFLLMNLPYLELPYFSLPTLCHHNYTLFYNTLPFLLIPNLIVDVLVYITYFPSLHLVPHLNLFPTLPELLVRAAA